MTDQPSIHPGHPLPFNLSSTCPKCGHDDVSTVYVPDGAPFPGRCGWWNGEHLDRACQLCHYVWPEEVLEHNQPPIRPGRPLPYPASAMPPLDDAPGASCPGYVPISKTCERCGQPPSEHSHWEDA